jgi:hypothetical protein
VSNIGRKPRQFRYAWLDAVFSESGPEGPVKRAVCAALFKHMDDHGRCWPSLATITKAAGCSRSTAADAINALDDEGWLERTSGNPTNSWHLATCRERERGLRRS